MPHPWETTALFLAQAVLPLSRSELRWEFANVAAAVTLLAIAFVSTAVFFFFRRTRDLILIYFGLFCSLYAVRLLAACGLFRSMFDAPRTLWAYVDWAITCTIIIPAGLFVYQMAGADLRKRFRWLIVAQALFAVFGLVAAALGVSLAELNTANNIVVLASVLFVGLFLAEAKRRSPRKRLTQEVRVFLAGLLIWLLFVVHNNLLGLRILPGHNVEFIGFLIFIGCLGYLSAYRAFANEERLLAINKELEIARRIQAATLPQSVPAIPGLEIAARCLPMSAVAGDFYDFLPMHERRLGILVADVSGHGIPAALIASMLKVAFASQEPHAGDPTRVLTGLNRALCGKFQEHFVTAAYLFVDLDRNLLRYSAAGHPPLMLVSRIDGEVREIEENGLVLGLFPDATYESAEIRLEPGHRCLLYTDGLFEARNAAQEEFGESRCKQFLAAQRDLPADRFINLLLENIAGFSGYNSRRAQEDDITLLVLDFHHATALT